MRKLLITGFEPFGGETVNPSWEAVKALDCIIGEWELVKLCIPVVFGEAAALVIDAAERLKADAVLCIGQAGGRDSITPEFVGINLAHASIPDNAGKQPLDEAIIEDGTAAYFTTVPVRHMVEAINAHNIKAKTSYSAGTYVCNDVLYSLLAHFDKTAVRCGFIHVPYESAQQKEGLPSMPLSDMVTALYAAIEVL